MDDAFGSCESLPFRGLGFPNTRLSRGVGRAQPRKRTDCENRTGRKRRIRACGVSFAFCGPAPACPAMAVVADVVTALMKLDNAIVADP